MQSIIQYRGAYFFWDLLTPYLCHTCPYIIMSRKIPGAFLCLTPFLIEFLNISVERLSEEIQADTF